MRDNPIKSFVGWYHGNGLRPYATALAGGAAIALGARLGWNPLVETIRSLGRPFGMKVFGGAAAEEDPAAARVAGGQWDMAMDNLKSRSDLRWKVPVGIGLLATALGLYGLARPGRQYYRLFDWNAPFVKK